MQFHLLKLHLCRIIRRLLAHLYLVPSRVSSLNLRQKWDTMQSTIQDVEELQQSLPEHLQIINLDQYQSEPPFQRQCVFLEILIQYTIVLASRPLLGSRNRAQEELDLPESIVAQWRMAAHQASYRAACATCAMVTEEKRKILGLTVHLLFAAWGMYSSAAELIALHAIKSPGGSEEAGEAYRNLGVMVRHFAEVQKIWPSTRQTYAILQDLVKVVLAKVEAESRMPSPEPAMANALPELSEMRMGEMDFHQQENTQINPLEGVDIQWFDEFLATQNGEPPRPLSEQPQGQADFSWLWSDISGVNLE
jgi:hypothetical protein